MKLTSLLPLSLALIVGSSAYATPLGLTATEQCQEYDQNKDGKMDHRTCVTTSDGVPISNSEFFYTPGRAIPHRERHDYDADGRWDLEIVRTFTRDGVRRREYDLGSSVMREYNEWDQLERTTTFINRETHWPPL